MNEESLPGFVQAAIQARKESRRAMHRAIRNVHKEYGGEEAQELLDLLYYHLPPSDVRSQDLRVRKQHPLGRSFTSHMLDLIHIKDRLQAYGVRVATGADKKLDRAFGEALGIPVPGVIAKEVSWEQCPLRENTVIKPERGSASRGVFLVDRNLSLFSFRSKRHYPDKASAEEELKKDARRSVSSRFRVEEAVLRADGKPANDWKAYAFYGEVAGVLEIDRSGDDNQHCWYTPEGECVRSPQRGKTFLQGQGISASMYDYAQRISSAAPVPFLRIDFHGGHDGVRLGEITPNAGGLEHGMIRPEWDRILSEYFLDAWARLLKDLLQGKQFDTYHQVYGNSIKSSDSSR